MVNLLLSKMNNYIDVIVPRGGKGLVEKAQRFSNVHVIGHLEVYVIFMLIKLQFKNCKKLLNNARK